MIDDVLGGLLLALIQSPRDVNMIAVIADRLEGADGNEPHSAAAWWRRYVKGVFLAERRWVLVVRDTTVFAGERFVTAKTDASPYWLGLADICNTLNGGVFDG